MNGPDGPEQRTADNEEYFAREFDEIEMRERNADNFTELVRSIAFSASRPPDLQLTKLLEGSVQIQLLKVQRATLAAVLAEALLMLDSCAALFESLDRQNVLKSTVAQSRAIMADCLK